MITLLSSKFDVHCSIFKSNNPLSAAGEERVDERSDVGVSPNVCKSKQTKHK